MARSRGLGDVYKRQEEEIQDPNAFYLIRHAASVVAADTAPYA
jgi:hypothetical protein